ncbi:MAG: hypothetical protein P9M14_10085 [Candidatus Alcyoniella australis]|nr:hypothetical protein [Candidatus Alcyoniella australis]
MSAPRRRSILLGSCIALAALLTLADYWYLSLDNMPLANNEFEFLQEARGLSGGEQSLLGLIRSKVHPPLLQLLAAPVALLCGQHNELTIAVFNGLWLLMTIYCTALCVQILSAGKRLLGPLIAAAISGTFSGVLAFSRVLTFEPMLAGLSMATVLCALLLYRRRNVRYALGLAALVLCGLATKGSYPLYVVAPLGALIVCDLWRSAGSRTRVAGRWALALALPVALAAPYYLHHMLTMATAVDAHTPDKLSWSGGWGGYFMYRHGVPQNFFLVYLQGLMRQSTGAPAPLLAALGCLVLALRRRWGLLALSIIWTAGTMLAFFCLGLLGVHSILCDRYLIPALPVFALIAGLALDQLQQSRGVRHAALIAVLGCCLLVAPVAQLLTPVGPPDKQFDYVEDDQTAVWVNDLQGRRYDHCGLLTPHHFDQSELRRLACRGGFGDLEIKCPQE